MGAKRESDGARAFTCWVALWQSGSAADPMCTRPPYNSGMHRITKLGGYVIGIGAGAAAVVWLVKDRLLGPETVPARPEDASASRVAPGPPSPPSVSDDDLSEVKGIGPVYRARLEQAGFTTFSALALATTAEIAAAAEIPTDKAADWIRQAGGLPAI